MKNIIEDKIINPPENEKAPLIKNEKPQQKEMGNSSGCCPAAADTNTNVCLSALLCASVWSTPPDHPSSNTDCCNSANACDPGNSQTCDCSGCDCQGCDCGGGTCLIM